MDASSPRRVKLDDLGRFMIDHQVCGAGFDVSHPQGIGGGLMTTRCRGCGASYEYSGTVFAREAKRQAEPAAAETVITGATSHLRSVPGPPAPQTVTPGRLAAVPPATPMIDEPFESVAESADAAELEAPELPALEPSGPPPPFRAGGPGPGEQSGGTERSDHDDPSKGKRSRRRARRISVAGHRPPAPKPGPTAKETDARGIRRITSAVALIVVIAVGAALVVTQLQSSDSESTPTPSTFPGADQGGATSNGADNPDAAVDPAASQASGAIRTISGPGFTVRAPRSWSESIKDGRMTLRPPNSDSVTVEILSQPIKPGDAAGAPQDIARFLAGRDASAKASPPSVHPVAGRPGFVVQAKGSQYTQDATGSVSGKNLLLAIRTTKNNAPSKLRRQAFGIAASLKPR